MVSNTLRILAIDPGYDRCGIAVVEESAGVPVIVHSACITTSKTLSHALRLSSLYTAITGLITEWQPTHFAIETLFFSVNKQTAMKVAEARGVLLATAGLHNLAIVELAPQTIKIAMTGNGAATKEQVQKMVMLTTKIDTVQKIDDEIDAIAVGIAALPIAKQKDF